MDHRSPTTVCLEGEPQEGGEDVATGKAESAFQVTQAGKIVAKRWVIHRAETRKAESCLSLRLRSGKDLGRQGSEAADRHRRLR